MAVIHGGDLESFYQEYQYDPLDFSANCNPLGVPAGVKSAICLGAEKIDAYPDPLCRRLCAALGRHENLSADKILCGNGSADLIDRLASAGKPGCALLTSPTFAEYERAIRSSGFTVRFHPLAAADDYCVTPAILDDLTPEVTMLFLCNPNNPTGLTVAPDLLLGILAKCSQNGTLLVLDECFNGFLDQPEAHSLKPYLDLYPNLLILKAFTKLYGMAGVRLGYCLSSNRALLERLRQSGQPWAVSSLAQAAGLAALGETAYVEAARQLVKSEREKMIRALQALTLKVYRSEANYLFFRASQPDLAEQLRKKGILIRDCSQYRSLGPGYYRVAIRTESENKRLIAALAACTGVET